MADEPGWCAGHAEREARARDLGEGTFDARGGEGGGWRERELKKVG